MKTVVSDVKEIVEQWESGLITTHEFVMKVASIILPLLKE